MSEFAQNPEAPATAEPVALTGTPEFDTTTTAPPTAEGLAAQAAAVAGSPTALAPPAATAQSASVPNVGGAPQASNGSLLTPEEKARVIAELEALARGQGAAAPANKATSTECDPNAAEPLESGCSTEQ